MPYDRHTGEYIPPKEEKESPKLETPYHCEVCGTRVDEGLLLTDDTAPRWCEKHSIKTYRSSSSPSSYGGPHQGCCFPAGTLVAISLNPTNQTYDAKRIETLKLGQSTLCLDYSSGIPIQGQIERVDVASEEILRRITFMNGKSVLCSPSQRLRDIRRKEWIRTARLYPGMELGDLVIKELGDIRWGKEVYSFVVQPFDNFLVLPDEDSTLLIAHDNSS